MSLLLCPHRTQALATLANALSIGRSNPIPPFQALFLWQPAGPDITRQPPPPHHQAQTHQSARARTPKHLRQTDTCGDSKAKGKAKATRKTSRQSEREDEERRNCSHLHPRTPPPPPQPKDPQRKPLGSDSGRKDSLATLAVTQQTATTKDEGPWNKRGPSLLPVICI